MSFNFYTLAYCFVPDPDIGKQLSEVDSTLLTCRQQQLEGLINRYLTASSASLPAQGVCAEPAYTGSNLSLAMLDEALLAGLGPKRRKQNLRRMKERNKQLEGSCPA